ncbi:2-oxoglutarate and Fe(II)-dependent oxygenase superfamily protein [Dorcoceras hygrometricum]|uniref:2-oxoglutarate and Fe(II)-dependent oxygenase superfamily protein n=1 Tax=Dorcoceras hygrometricum TaxID=472368 RepID=A0A2Z7CN00_9LAMI|nr:2-oxoglutarate and Fe(II)-dependent oxygenase superfamily protein [Dorcoceras hygrometricum]
MEMLQAFDEAKSGVKGLLDSGIQKLPKIFIRPFEELLQESTNHNHKRENIQVPVIDFCEIWKPDRRKQIVEEVRTASETWGFFQVINHGIPLPVLDGMIEGVREFNEQGLEEKKKYYSRDNTKAVRFISNYDLSWSTTASWRDTLTLSFSDADHPHGNELPPSCREPAIQYSKHVEILGNLILGLLSDGLGLEADSLKNMECSKGHRLHCHYYPPCPEPELAIGIGNHFDAGFLTILLQGHATRGLQVMHEGQWVDIEPVRGTLVVNIGDLLQLVSNGKLRSSGHRAVCNGFGPRISVACFFSGPVNEAKIYGPIKELLSHENPPVYKEVALSEYLVKFFAGGLDNHRALDYFKL